LLLLETVRCPCELVEAVVEVVGDIGARFAPGLGGLGREVDVEVGGEDGFAGCRVDGVPVGIEFRGMARRVVGARTVVGGWL